MVEKEEPIIEEEESDTDQSLSNEHEHAVQRSSVQRSSDEKDVDSDEFKERQARWNSDPFAS